MKETTNMIILINTTKDKGHDPMKEVAIALKIKGIASLCTTHHRPNNKKDTSNIIVGKKMTITNPASNIPPAKIVTRTLRILTKENHPRQQRYKHIYQ